MPKLIKDSFSDLPITRQRRYQLRREKEGRCRVCGKGTGPLCKKHLAIQAATMRRLNGKDTRVGAAFI
jgi:hypothetical protein